MSILEGLAGHFNAGGMRAVLAISAYRFIRRPKEIALRAKGIKHPVHIRLRTTDLAVFHEMLIREEYSLSLPWSPRIIVDAGANIGMSSIYYTHKYPDARIFAIEAEASNFALLAKNARPYPNIVPIHAALWNRDGEIGVSEPDPATGAFGKWGFVTREGTGAPVRAISMRTLMAEMQIPCIDLLKMDIEGSEKEVFEHCNWNGQRGLPCDRVA
jgi:FkbM family methyltransferase